MFKQWMTCAGIALATAMSLGTAHAEELNFGIISTETTQALKAKWQPLVDDMERKTGYTIKPFFASDYAGVIEGMRFNKVQLAWFGNKSAMEAVDRANGEIFAQMVSADGAQGYYSHLIVNKDSPINNIQDMLANAKNLSFGNGDPNSTSGYLVPSYYVFAQNHVDAKTAFKVVRSGSHEVNALAVINKQVDVATNNSENLSIVKNTAPEKFKQIKIIWTSPLIALDPLVERRDLPDAVKAKIKDFFVNYGKTDAHEKEVLKQINGLSGFRESSNAQLKPIRQLDLFSQRVKLEADATLGETEKKNAIAELDRKLAALN